MTQRRTKAEVSKILKQFKASGLSCPKYATKIGVSKHTLANWMSKAHWEDPGSSKRSIVEVYPSPSRLSASSEVKLEFRGVSVGLPLDIDANRLFAIFSAVVKS